MRELESQFVGAKADGRERLKRVATSGLRTRPNLAVLNSTFDADQRIPRRQSGSSRPIPGTDRIERIAAKRPFTVCRKLIWPDVCQECKTNLTSFCDQNSETSGINSARDTRRESLFGDDGSC